MDIKLPLLINGDLMYSINSTRMKCSENCLYNKENLLAFHLPGLGTETNHINYPILTRNNTLVKKKNKSLREWKKLSYDYTISPTEQQNILSDLIQLNIDGVVNIISQCDCSIETVYFNGTLLGSNALPNTNHYEISFECLSNWSYDSLKSFLNYSITTITNIHKRGYIHGDLTVHNFLTLEHKEYLLIDLDNISYGSEDKFIQDWVCFLLYTVVPIFNTFNKIDQINSLIGRALEIVFSFKEEEIGIRLLDMFNNKINHSRICYSSSSVFDSVVNSYLYNFDLMSEVYTLNLGFKNKERELQVELLESNRIKDNYMKEIKSAFEAERKETQKYIDDILSRFSEAENYAKNLQRRIKEIESQNDILLEQVNVLNENLIREIKTRTNLENVLKREQEKIINTNALKGFINRNKSR